MELPQRSTLLFNGDIFQSFNTARLRELPGFKDIQSGPTPIAVTIDLPINETHVTLLSKTLEGRSVSTNEVDSHLDVYLFLKLAHHFEVPIGKIQKSFTGWTASESWIGLSHPGYLYLIYNVLEDLVDWKKYFREYDEPFEIIEATTALSARYCEAGTLVNALRFYRSFKLSSIFDESDDKTREKLQTLKQQRKDALNAALLDPYFGHFNGYFVYTPSIEEVWNCDGISVIDRPKIGQTTLATYPEFLQRLNQFTYGWLEKSPNPEMKDNKFPWDNVIIAGGSVMQMLDHKFNPKKSSDVDLFIYGKTYEEKLRAFNDIVNWFKTDRTFYALVGSVLSIYLIDVNRKFQIINTNNKTIHEVIGRFDMTHIQWAVSRTNDRYKVLGTAEALLSFRDMISRFGCTQRCKTERLIKTLYRGRDIIKDPKVVQDIVDITDLIKDVNNPNLKRIIRTFHQYYYPTYVGKTDGMSADELEEQHQHMEGMIAQDSKAQFVTRDVNFAVNNIVLNGNFTTDYEAMSFVNFNPATVVHQGVARRHVKAPIKDKNGIIRLMSGELHVTGIINNEEGSEILAMVKDPLFTDHIDILERAVFRMFNHNPVTTHIINQDGKMRLFLGRFMLDKQMSKGFTVLKSKKGENLNIEEDLTIDDVIQIIYTMEANCNRDTRYMEIRPIKIIKVNEHKPVEEDLVEQNNKEGLGDTPNTSTPLVAYDDVVIETPVIPQKTVEKRAHVDKTPDTKKIVEAKARIVARKEIFAAKKAAREPKKKEVPLEPEEGSDGEVDE